MNARRSKKQLEAAEQRDQGGRKGDKFRAIKAREAAAKAAEQAGGTASASAAPPAAEEQGKAE